MNLSSKLAAGRPQRLLGKSAARLLALLAPALALAGCQVDDILRNDRQTWLWLVLPLAGFLLVGTFLVSIRRGRQLEMWDLRASAEAPSARRIVMVTLLVAGFLAAVFAVYNLFAVGEIAWMQKLENVGYWLAGTLAGGTGALIGGLKLAERKSARPAHSGRS
jgi:hypothetical protein